MAILLSLKEGEFSIIHATIYLTKINKKLTVKAGHVTSPVCAIALTRYYLSLPFLVTCREPQLDHAIAAKKCDKTNRMLDVLFYV